MEQFQQSVAGGWTNDSEPSMQPPNTVREMQNMRIVSNDFNTFSSETLLGTFDSFGLNPNYFVLGWCANNLQVIIFSTRDLTGAGDTNGEIGIATIDPATNIGTYVPYYNHALLKFSSAHQIECHAYDENESILRVYWTDFYNPFRALNLRNPKLTAYIAVGSLVVGQQYMVLTNSVTNGTNTYGPNATAIIGTVFTADGTEVYNNSPLVIEYVNVSTIDTTPTRDQGNITFNGWISGGFLTSGSYQYIYQLTTTDGQKSTFSDLSMPFHTGNAVTPYGDSILLSSNGTLSYQQYQGELTNFDSTKGQRIQIDNIDLDWNRITVVAIRDTSINTADAPVIIFDGPITGATMTFNHYGNETLGSLSTADLEATVLAIQRIRTFDFLKQKSFIGDVELSPFIQFDKTGTTIAVCEYMIPSEHCSNNGRPNTGTNAINSGLVGHTLAKQSGVLSGDILTDQWYKVVSGTGTVQYPIAGPIYNVGDIFQGTATNYTYAITGFPVVTPILHIQKYTGVYEDILLLEDYCDNKNAAVATHVRSLHRSETYRIGILFYDVFQNPQQVQWLADQVMPNIDDTPVTVSPHLCAEYDGGKAASLRNLGLKFSGLDFNLVATNLGCSLADLPKFIGGFSIVRAKRDAQVLGQGLLSCTAVDGSGVIHPLVTTDKAYDANYAGHGLAANVFTFSCPEFLFNYNGLPNALAGDKVVIQDYLIDNHRAEAPYGTQETNFSSNNYNYYEKFYAQGSFGTTLEQNYLITASASGAVSPGDNGVSVGLGTFDQRAKTAGGAPAPFNVNPYQSTGGWTYVIYQGANFGNNVASDHNTTLVNYVRPKAQLYGGTGDSALAATEYIFCGHYQPFDAAFVAYMVSNVGAKGVGIVNDIEVFGGDTFVQFFDFGRSIPDLDLTHFPNVCSFGQIFPVESAINLSLRGPGRNLAKDRTYDPTVCVNGLSFGNPQQLETFIYNASYSYEESQIVFTAVPVNFIPHSKFLRRVYVSPTKIDGESVDSFRIYPINNFKDLDGRSGELINLRTKTGSLFYFQQIAVGYLPVEERTTIANSLGNPVTVGVGGVLERYDDFSDFYGNQHQFGLAETENAFVWFDAYRKEFCIMPVGSAVTSISTVKGLRQFSQNIFGDCITSDNPIRSLGIAAAFNPAIKEVIFSFRGVTPVYGSAQTPQGFSIGLDYINKQFTGKFDFLPGIMLEFNNMLICSYSGFYNTILANEPYYQWIDSVSDGTDIYVCVLAFTTGGSPVAPHSDPTHWKLVCSINEVHIADRGDVAKFFGRVYGNSITMVQNPANGVDKVFDTQSLVGSQDFFDSNTTFNTVQTVTENIIGNSQYGYINRTWYWSIPFGNDGDRMRDNWMMTQLSKDNTLNGDVTVSSNERIMLVNISTGWRKTF